LAYGILRDAHAAEDVCQQAFLRACECGPATGQSAALHAWLAKVVVNESLQLLRRKKCERSVLQNASWSRQATAQSGANPGVREQVMVALAELPETTRLVVVLRIMEGISGNEVKELLGCSASEVSRRLYLGVEELRTRLTGVRRQVFEE